ncbi:ABC transporter ATP-binding protein [Bordetella genomosp. 12]|uniref:ABC transporter domain-containing protein n=1 Tax=Bordetella genomosp. 12 TaxID=463035 RepID=A0A261VDG7_9BORD|nr:ABC transporter ATP-binding protein [Bordetella genomosp. 12]OZI72186.1 hypothetical protein CAL22_20690 [Bordetella genomosp. 12]
MSKPIIEISDLSKMFRMFRSPRYRMMETLGLPVPSSSYEEFWALRDINFNVMPGERIGLIGRNGAGKSTLLKIVAGLLRPTSGQARVNGEVQALMELGTGFHPEFTGRANAVSALAYQGVTGRRAQQLLESIIEFSELDEFMDKPVKTYSAGMYSRLAFAVATAVRPQILIIDEILGAGDAYFAAKSAARMHELTSQGTTVLFVSHDMASVQMICDRCIWIERGRMIMDSDPNDVSKRYALSIRKQEELRLRAINLKLQRGHVSELLTSTDLDKTLVLRLVTAEHCAPQTPVPVYQVDLLHHDEVLESLIVGDARDDDRSERLHLLTAKGFMEWGPPAKTRAGKPYRLVGRFKGSYNHAPISLRLPQGMGDDTGFKVRITHGPVSPTEPLILQLFDGVDYVTLGTLDATGQDSAESVIAMRAAATEEAEPPKEEPVERDEFTYGTGDAWITDVDFLDADGNSHRLFHFSEPMYVKIGWQTKKPIARLSFVVCIYGLDGRCVSQVVSPFVSTDIEGQQGVITAAFEPLRVGKGDYLVSIGIFDGLTTHSQEEATAYEVQDRKYRLRVTPPPQALLERGLVVDDARWTVTPRTGGQG